MKTTADRIREVKAIRDQLLALPTINELFPTVKEYAKRLGVTSACIHGWSRKGYLSIRVYNKIGYVLGEGKSCPILLEVGPKQTRTLKVVAAEEHIRLLRDYLTVYLDCPSYRKRLSLNCTPGNKRGFASRQKPKPDTYPSGLTVSTSL